VTLTHFSIIDRLSTQKKIVENLKKLNDTINHFSLVVVYRTNAKYTFVWQGHKGGAYAYLNKSQFISKYFSFARDMVSYTLIPGRRWRQRVLISRSSWPRKKKKFSFIECVF
jgi:hypothetical protein